MELSSFASATRNPLLPQQQSTRSYASQETGSEPVDFTLLKHRTGVSGKKFILRYVPRLPFGKKWTEISNKQIKDFAVRHMLANTDRGDDKYIKIEQASKSWIEYSFDAEAWIKDNFRGKKPKYQVPITLKFRYRRDIPRFFHVNTQYSELSKFILSKFKEFIKKNDRTLKHRKFSFLDRITPDIFEFRLDSQSMHINASLKYSVILGSLAAYMLFFHGKDITGKEKDVKRKVSRYSDVKKLERYVRKI